MSIKEYLEARRDLEKEKTVIKIEGFDFEWLGLAIVLAALIMKG